MSPFRNALPLPIKLVNKACENVLVRTVLRGLSRTVAVPDTGLTWSLNSGPWFRNGVMTVVLDGPRNDVLRALQNKQPNQTEGAA